jgi:signal transduction histidine kinase
MIETYLRFNLHGMLSVFSGLLCLALGLMVYAKDRTSGVNRAFFLFTLNATIWIISFGAISLLKYPVDENIFTMSAYVYGIPFIPVNSYLFSVRFRGNKENRTFLWVGYGWAAIMALWQIFRVDHVNIVEDFSWGRYGVWENNLESTLQTIYLVIPFYAYSLRGFWHLYRGYRESQTNPDKIRFRNCLIGFLIAYTGSIDFLPASGFNVYAFGYLSLTGFTAILAYTIIRHQLLDIRIVLKKLSLILVIYLGLFLLLLPTAAPLLKHLLSDPKNNPVTTTFGVGIAIGLIFSLGPLIYAYLVRHSFWLKSNLTAGLTHELKSPLGIISGAVDVVLENIDGPTINRERLRDYGQIIRANVVRMDTFVKDLLNLAKIQEDAISLTKEHVHMSHLIADVTEALRPLSNQKNIQIVSHVADDISLTADNDKIKQVVSSLLSNAIKYSDKGTVTITLTKTSKEIIFSIMDEGRGVEEKDLGRIFDRFYQVNPGSKGSGIGLTIAKAWVEAHRGRIWAESAGAGKGTTIRFTLPL